MHCHVDRTSLLLRMEDEFTREGLVFVAAPDGFGKTTLLADVAARWRARHGAGSPVVSVDCAHREALAFLGCYRGRRAEGQPVSTAQARARRFLPFRRLEGMGLAPDPCPAVPDDPLCQLVWGYVDEVAVGWSDALRALAPSACAPLDNAPLVLIDNLPFLGSESSRARMAQVLRAWSRAGACAVVASSPSRDVSEAEFPAALRLDSRDLRVGPAEMGLWARDLLLPDVPDMLRDTCGVPALVDACRALGRGTGVRDDPGVLRRSARVLEACLREEVPHTVERLEWGMALLGEGRLRDLAEMGVVQRPDDLAVIERDYPLFGVDLSEGTFRAVPTSPAAMHDLFLEVVAHDPGLAASCAGVLARERRFARAGALLRLLPDRALTEALGANAAAFADIAPDDVLVRGLRHQRDHGDASPEAARGIARLEALRAFSRAPSPARAALAVPGRDEEGWSDVLEAAVAMRGAWASGPRAPAATGEPDGLGATCRRLVDAAVRCDPARAAQARDALFDRLGGLSLLAARLLCHHATLCTMLAGAPEEALAWLAGTAAYTLPPEEPESAEPPGTLTEALLRADVCAARLMACRHGREETARRLAVVRRCRVFVGGRGLAGAFPMTGALESLCCVLEGRASEVRDVVEGCMAAFSAVGSEYGQLLCLFARCAAGMERGMPEQAEASARAAQRMAGRLRARELGEYASLLRALATWPALSVASTDGRLLEVALRESALRPRRSLPLTLERAVLSCAKGDADETGLAMGEAVSDGRGLSLRVACCAIRLAGSARTRLCELSPAEVRAELAASGRTAGGVPRALGAPADPSPLDVRLFGGMRVEVSGHVVSEGEWGRTKSRQLMGLLCLRAERPLQRRELCALLWPDRPLAQARTSLSAALTTLRGVLGQKNGGPQFVLTAADAVRLNLELVDVDVLRFETLARDALARRDALPDKDLFDVCTRLERLYRDGLDPAFDYLGEAGEGRSAELQALFADCMTRASERALGCGDAGLALWFSDAARRACPHREDVSLARIRALRGLARPREALEAYRELAEFGRDVYGTRPSQALRDERDAAERELARLGGPATPSPDGGRVQEARSLPDLSVALVPRPFVEGAPDGPAPAAGDAPDGVEDEPAAAFAVLAATGGDAPTTPPVLAEVIGKGAAAMVALG